MDGFGRRLRAGSRRGSAVVEYGILAGLVAVVSVGAVSTLGGKVEESFGTTTAHLETAEGAAVDAGPLSAGPEGSGSASAAQAAPAPEGETAPQVDYTLGTWSFTYSGFEYAGGDDSKVIAPPEGVDISHPGGPVGFIPDTGMVYGVDLGSQGSFYRAHVDDETLEVFASANDFDFQGMHYSASTDRLLTFLAGNAFGNSTGMSGYTDPGQDELLLVMVNPDTGAMHMIGQAIFSEVEGGMDGYENGTAFITSSDANGVVATFYDFFGGPYMTVRYDYASDKFIRQ
jgi:pilus assembly protein Flp/PilA